MKKEEVEEIRKAADARLNLLSPEDEVTKEFFESSNAFFSSFMSKSNGFQRDDYGEFAHLIMVRRVSINKFVYTTIRCSPTSLSAERKRYGLMDLQTDRHALL